MVCCISNSRESQNVSADPPSPLTLRDGFIRSKVNFSKHDHDAYQIKGNHKILLQTPLTPGPWGMGSIGLKSIFLENGHVAYQIKGDHNIFAA